MPTTSDAIGLPFEEAIEFFRGKVRIPTDHWTGVWKEAHARGFMVAGAASDALLKDFQEALQKALTHGTTLVEFRKDFDEIVKRHGWAHTGEPGWRAKVIYNTNLSAAYAAGRYAQQTDPATLRHFPYWQYRHSACRHPRLMHLAWDGLTLRADDPWWDTHYPPNGWHCGCRVSIVSERGLRAMGKSGPDPSPGTVTKPWVNPRTGETHQVPVGVDPGFDYNVGKAWQQGRAAELPVKAPDLKPKPLPALTGTPKQIDYATKVRATALDVIREALATGERKPTQPNVRSLDDALNTFEGASDRAYAGIERAKLPPDATREQLRERNAAYYAARLAWVTQALENEIAWLEGADDAGEILDSYSMRSDPVGDAIRAALREAKLAATKK